MTKKTTKIEVNKLSNARGAGGSGDGDDPNRKRAAQDDESKKTIENLKNSIDSMNKTLEKLQRALIDTTSANKRLTKEFNKSSSASKSDKGKTNSEVGVSFSEELHRRKENDRVTNDLLRLMKSIDTDNKLWSSKNIAKSFAKELKKEGILTRDKKGFHINENLSADELKDLEQRIREKKTEIAQNDYAKTHSKWGEELYDKTVNGAANFATNHGMAMSGSLMSTGLGLMTGGILNPVLVHQLGLDKLATKALGGGIKGIGKLGKAAWNAPGYIAEKLFGGKKQNPGKTSSASEKKPLEKIEKSVEKIEKNLSKRKDPLTQQKEEKDGFFSKLLALVMPFISGIGSVLTKFAGIGGVGYMGYQGYQAYKDFKNGNKLEGTQHALKAGVSGIGGVIGGILGGPKGAQWGAALGAGAAEIAEKVGGWLGDKIGDYIWKVVQGFKKMKTWISEKLQKLVEPFKQMGEWVAKKINSVKKFFGFGGPETPEEQDERMENAKKQVAEMRAKKNGTSVEEEMDIINTSMKRRREEAEIGTTGPVEEDIQNKTRDLFLGKELSVARETDTTENGNHVHIIEYSTQSMPNEQSLYMDTLSAQQEQQAQMTTELIEKSMNNQMMSTIDNSTTIVNPSVHQINAPGMG